MKKDQIVGGLYLGFGSLPQPGGWPVGFVPGTGSLPGGSLGVAVPGACGVTPAVVVGTAAGSPLGTAVGSEVTVAVGSAVVLLGGTALRATGAGGVAVG